MQRSILNIVHNIFYFFAHFDGTELKLNQLLVPFAQL